MRKILAILVVVSLFSLGAASFKGQIGLGDTGMTYGLGYSMPVIPGILKVGIEGQMGGLGSFTQKGSFTTEVAGVDQQIDYDSTLTVKTLRYGMFLDLNVPAVKHIPIIGFLSSPTIHFGAQEWDFDLDGQAKSPFANTLLNASGVDPEVTKTAYGSYWAIGWPVYFGPFYSEISIGTHNLSIKKIGRWTDIPTIQWSLGASFF